MVWVHAEHHSADLRPGNTKRTGMSDLELSWTNSSSLWWQATRCLSPACTAEYIKSGSPRCNTYVKAINLCNYSFQKTIRMPLVSTLLFQSYDSGHSAPTRLLNAKEEAIYDSLKREFIHPQENCFVCRAPL